MKSISDNYPALLIGILIGLAAGIVVGMWAPPASFKVPAECGSGGFWCFVDRWQTLLAGGAALLGAALTVRKIQKQINQTNWQHAKEEIEGLKDEKNRFLPKIKLPPPEIESIDRFAAGTNSTAWTTEVFVANKILQPFKARISAANFEFDLTVGGRDLDHQRELLRQDIQSANETIQQAAAEIGKIKLPPDGIDPNGIEPRRWSQLRNQFVRDACNSDAMARIRKAYERADLAIKAYPSSIDDRIKHIMNRYHLD